MPKQIVKAQTISSDNGILKAANTDAHVRRGNKFGIMLIKPILIDRKARDIMISIINEAAAKLSAISFNIRCKYLPQPTAPPAKPNLKPGFDLVSSSSFNSSLS